MNILKTINQVLAFSLELVMFFSIFWWGFQQGKQLVSKWAIALFCFAVAVTLWGVFAAPKSAHRIKFPNRLLFESGMFLLGTIALIRTHNVRWAIAFTVLFVISIILAFINPDE